ncbi:hypothetical protein [Pectinatus frisingensis]|uniref:hypothetical protein n=1 Tax=Pectinatus frisingensis TaxID=865 RepID=UPI0018C60AB7|nr:hypothetical protein [Pectinatus frisingensis]
MGFITKTIKSLFSPDVQTVSTASGITAQDLVASTSSNDPEAPVMGDNGKKKVRGVNSLLVPTENVMKGQ